jgi:hypothetical protein
LLRAVARIQSGQCRSLLMGYLSTITIIAMSPIRSSWSWSFLSSFYLAAFGVGFGG